MNLSCEPVKTKPEVFQRLAGGKGAPAPATTGMHAQSRFIPEGWQPHGTAWSGSERSKACESGWRTPSGNGDRGSRCHGRMVAGIPPGCTFVFAI